MANIAYLAVLPMDAIQNAPADRVGTAAGGGYIWELLLYG